MVSRQPSEGARGSQAISVASVGSAGKSFDSRPKRILMIRARGVEPAAVARHISVGIWRALLGTAGHDRPWGRNQRPTPRAVSRPRACWLSPSTRPCASGTPVERMPNFPSKFLIAAALRDLATRVRRLVTFKEPGIVGCRLDDLIGRHNAYLNKIFFPIHFYLSISKGWIGIRAKDI